MISVKEATSFFQSYEMDCDEQLVREWMDTTPVGLNLRVGEKIDEWDMYNFGEWLRVLGTAYEEGIDDQTKIARFIEEIYDLKKKAKELQNELTKQKPLPF